MYDVRRMMYDVRWLMEDRIINGRVRRVKVPLLTRPDEAVYKRFMQPDTTVVKTSESETGRKGYANVEFIVREIKQEVPVAHIMGIRDADYSRYEEEYTVSENIFLTDRRDLEMMLLETESVKHTLRVWLPMYDEAFAKCIPICRHFGYLRIFNWQNTEGVNVLVA